MHSSVNIAFSIRIFVSKWTKIMVGLLLFLINSTSVYAQSTSTDPVLMFPDVKAVTPLGVNMQNGKFSYSVNDLSIGSLKFTRSWGDMGNIFSTPNPGAGHVFGLIPTYNGKSGGWTHNFGNGYVINSESMNAGQVTMVYVYVDGKSYKFWEAYTNALTPWNKSASGANFDGTVLTDQAGNRYKFAASSFSFLGTLPINPILLTHVDYADGSALDYYYNSNNQPHAVISNHGYAIVMDYDANQNIATVCGYNTALTYVSGSSTCAGATLKVTYSYDSSGTFLQSVTDVTGQITTISAGALQGGNLLPAPSCITFPGSSTCKIQNIIATQPDGDGAACCHKPYEIGEQIDAAGNKWLYDYDEAATFADVPYAPGMPRFSGSTMTDPTGQSYGYGFDRGVIYSIGEPDGIRSLRYLQNVEQTNGYVPYTFDIHDTSPTLVTQPDGHYEYYTHDLRSNVTFKFIYPKGHSFPATSFANNDQALCCVAPSSTDPQDSGATIFYARQYLPDYFGVSGLYPTGCGAGLADAAHCDKPIKAWDGNGNETDWAYTAWGAVQSEMQPAPTAGAARPLKLFSYVQKYAWVQNSSGSLVSVALPVWLISSETVCQTVAGSSTSTCDTSAPQLVTNYLYGGDGTAGSLLLHGKVEDATGAKLTTCYSYDWMGNTISQTSPRAGLTSCP